MKKTATLLAVAVAVILFAGQRAYADGCPATVATPIGDANSCYVITINPNLTLSFGSSGSVFLDPAGDDPLIEVINDASVEVGSINLTGVGLFAFNGDGLCSGLWAGAPAGCPFDLTTYAGPTTWFSGYNSLGDFGTVNFTGGLASRGSTYFSLENPPTGGTASTVPEPGSIFLLGSGLTGLGALRKRIRKG